VNHQHRRPLPARPAGPDQALAALDAALTRDPYNEHLYQKIMQLQAEAGRPEAVRQTPAPGP
jgi:DNA-binding SARP family transcriptional activator